MTMDDRFMQTLKRDPDPEFGRRLRDRLHRDETEVEEPAPRAPRWAVLAPALLVAALASVILFPSVRASAQAFLDLFRVRNFTAVSVNPERLRQFQDGKLDLKTLIGDKVETVKEPGATQVVDSPTAAGVAAGIDVMVPRTLPNGLAAGEVSWHGPGEVRVTADVSRLRTLLDALEIRDVAIPLSIDGQVVDIKVPAVVEQHFENGTSHVQFLQARSPEVGLPTGVDLPALGEIGLRILGLDAAEARRLAQSIDWRSTMLIPVPGDVGSFRQVDVGGQSGLMVTMTGVRKDGRPREGSMVLWSRNDMVFALMGNIRDADLLNMANSVQ
jgi:hypothetical protein